jgi:hypothetical protein
LAGIPPFFLPAALLQVFVPVLPPGRLLDFYGVPKLFVLGLELFRRRLPRAIRIQAQGNVEIKGLMVSLNRMERGKGDKSALEEIQETYGFPANAIVTMEDVITYLYNRPCQGKIQIDDKMKAAIDAYYEEYGVK